MQAANTVARDDTRRRAATDARVFAPPSRGACVAEGAVMTKHFLAALALAVGSLSIAACNIAPGGGSDDKKADAPSSKTAAPDFPYSSELGPACRANVEFLVGCANRNNEPDKSDLLGRAKTMQTAYLDNIKKKGRSTADVECKGLESMVRMNPRCK